MPLLSSLALLAALSGTAHASIPDLIGMGPANIGSGDASTALADDAYATYYNPAGLSQLKQITFSAGPVVGQALLRPFKGIVYDTNGDGLTQDLQGYPDYGDVGADYRLSSGGKTNALYTNGLQLGLVVPFWRYFAFGIAAYLPTGSLIHISVADPFIPYYVMFADRNNRFSLTPAFSVNPIQGVYLGGGMEVMANIVATVKAGVNANVSAFPTGGDGSSMLNGSVKAGVSQLSADVLPVIALNGGLLIDGSVLGSPDNAEQGARLRRHAIGVSYRGSWMTKVDADVTATTTGLIRFDDQTVLLSSLLSEPVHVQLKNLIGFYTPANLSVGVRTGFGDLRGANGRLEDRARVTLTADADYTYWSGYQEMVSPATTVTVNAIEGTQVSIQVGDDYGPPKFRNTLSFRGGARYTLDLSKGNRAFGPLRLNLRAGGGYVPSAVPDQTGLTNYMDSDRIVGSLGVGIEAAQLRPRENWAPISKGPIQIDVGGQVQDLRTRTVTKDAALLADSDGDGIVDYPRGYPLGGQITSDGLYLALMVGFQMQLGDPMRPAKALRRSKIAPTAPVDGGAL